MNRHTRPPARTAHHPLPTLLIALSLGLACVPAVADKSEQKTASALAGKRKDAIVFSEIPATHQHLKALRDGGFVLYLRHGPTDNTKADQVPRVDLNDCTTQRLLTVAGWQLMTQVGAAMRKAQIPVGELHVSPMCRAKDSAAAAFPAITPTVDHNLMYVANFTAAEKAPILANTRALLSAPAPAHTNRVLLAHAPNLMDLIGYFPKEGTLVIFRPLGEQTGFEYVASIVPTGWDALLK